MVLTRRTAEAVPAERVEQAKRAGTRIRGRCMRRSLFDGSRTEESTASPRDAQAMALGNSQPGRGCDRAMRLRCFSWSHHEPIASRPSVEARAGERSLPRAAVRFREGRLAGRARLGGRRELDLHHDPGLIVSVTQAAFPADFPDSSGHEGQPEAHAGDLSGEGLLALKTGVPGRPRAAAGS